MTPTIEIDHLTKRYGATTAVNDLTLQIPKGSVCGLLGPNGAGKTTTFKCILGLARSSWGTVRFDGAPLAAETFERLSYVPRKACCMNGCPGRTSRGGSPQLLALRCPASRRADELVRPR